VYGLSDEQVHSSQMQHGLNELPRQKGKSFFSVFFNQFLNPLIYLLLFATLIAFFLGDLQDALVIFFVILINSFIGSVHEIRAEHSLNSILKYSKLKARVLRNGALVEIEARFLVPGDIFYLSSGDSVPADARIIECFNLMASEANLTGESLPIVKISSPLFEEKSITDCKNMLFAGTNVVGGRGVAIAVSTGLNNEIGKIAKIATEAVVPKTQLEIKISLYSKWISYFGVAFFLLVLGIGSLKGIEFTFRCSRITWICYCYLYR